MINNKLNYLEQRIIQIENESHKTHTKALNKNPCQISKNQNINFKQQFKIYKNGRCGTDGVIKTQTTHKNSEHTNGGKENYFHKFSDQNNDWIQDGIGSIGDINDKSI